jgi:hypothetical protein
MIKKSGKGRMWIAVLAALGCGLAIGYLIDRPETPIDRPETPKVMTTQEAADSIAKPLPLPPGAKLVGIIGIGHEGLGPGSLAWDKGIVLDVSGMTKQDIAAIPRMYESHFQNQFPIVISSRGSYYDLAKFGPDDFISAGNGDWTWHVRAEGNGNNFDFEMQTEVMDFAPIGSRFKRIRVRELDNPVQGQRIMWIRINLRVRGLVGPGLQMKPTTVGLVTADAS